MVDDGGVARFCITMAAVAAAGLLGACSLFQSTAAEPAAERTNPAMYGEVSRGASHLVPMNSAVSLAMGFASLTGEVRGHCVEVVETQPSGSSLDELEVYYAEDSSSLSRALGVEAHAGAEFGFVNVSAEAEYVTSSVTTHSASFLVVHSVALAPMDALIHYRLTDEALAELRASPQHFYRRCGDQFVAAVQKGATFNAIARIDAASTADRDYLRAHARASYLGFEGGAGVDKEVETKMERLQAQFHVIQSGRQQPIPTFDDFVERARTLNAEIRDTTSSGHVVRFETKPYDIAENWPAGVTLPSLHEQARTLEELAVRHRTLSVHVAGRPARGPGGAEEPSLRKRAATLRARDRELRRCPEASGRTRPCLRDLADVRVPHGGLGSGANERSQRHCRVLQRSRQAGRAGASAQAKGAASRRRGSTRGGGQAGGDPACGGLSGDTRCRVQPLPDLGIRRAGVRRAESQAQR